MAVAMAAAEGGGVAEVTGTGILIVCAGEAPGLGIASALDLDRHPPTVFLPGVCFYSDRRGTALVLTRRYGPEIAIVAVTLALRECRFAVALVVVAGQCGALDPTLAIGEAVVCSTVFFFEKRIASFGELSKRAGVDERGSWPWAGEVVRRLRTAGVSCRLGKLGSGRSFDADETGLRWLQQHEAVAKDMESSAVAWACAQHNLPVLPVRVVSNHVCTPSAAPDTDTDTDTAGPAPATAPTDKAATKDTDTVPELGGSTATAPVSDQATVPALARCVSATLEAARAILRGAALRPGVLGRRKEHAVGIVVAMLAEARPLAASLGLREDGVAGLTDYGFCAFTGRFDGVRIVMVAHGTDVAFGMDRVGPEVAVFATAQLAEAFSCLAIVNAGTAGAMPETHAVGQVVAASTVLFIDRRVDGLEAVDGGQSRARHLSLGSVAGPGPGSGAAAYPVWHRTAELTAALAAEGVATLEAAVVGTSSSFDPSAADLAAIASTGVSVKEMEGAGVGFVCSLHHIPFVCLKAVTDVVGAATGPADFQHNLDTSMGNLRSAFPHAVRFIARHFDTARTADL